MKNTAILLFIPLILCAPQVDISSILSEVNSVLASASGATLSSYVSEATAAIASLEQIPGYSAIVSAYLPEISAIEASLATNSKFASLTSEYSSFINQATDGAEMTGTLSHSEPARPTPMGVPAMVPGTTNGTICVPLPIVNGTAMSMPHDVNGTAHGPHHMHNATAIGGYHAVNGTAGRPPRPTDSGHGEACMAPAPLNSTSSVMTISSLATAGAVSTTGAAASTTYTGAVEKAGLPTAGLVGVGILGLAAFL